MEASFSGIANMLFCIVHFLLHKSQNSRCTKKHIIGKGSCTASIYLKPVQHETDEIPVTKNFEDTAQKYWSNKDYVTEAHSKQCPGHFHFSALNLLPGFHDSENLFSENALFWPKYIYKFSLRNEDDLVVVRQIPK
jgi:hypothetical protein